MITNEVRSGPGTDSGAPGRSMLLASCCRAWPRWPSTCSSWSGHPRGRLRPDAGCPSSTRSATSTTSWPSSGVPIVLGWVAAIALAGGYAAHVWPGGHRVQARRARDDDRGRHHRGRLLPHEVPVLPRLLLPPHPLRGASPAPRPLRAAPGGPRPAPPRPPGQPRRRRRARPSGSTRSPGCSTASAGSATGSWGPGAGLRVGRADPRRCPGARHDRRTAAAVGRRRGATSCSSPAARCLRPADAARRLGPRRHSVQIIVVPGLTDVASERVRVRPVGGPAADAPRGARARRHAAHGAKRVFDLVGSPPCCSLLSAPLFVGTALADQAARRRPGALPPDARRPRRRPFDCLKFRSMVIDAERCSPSRRPQTSTSDGHVLFKARTTRASPGPGASSAASPSTSCPSSSTCCAAR